jgi:hypothetical protein
MSTIKETPLARKIRALMAQASDPGIGEIEAAAFMAKVQELLVKNGLSMADVAKDDEVERGDITGQEFAEAWKSPSRKNVLRAVCRYYMCEAIGPARAGQRWTIIGRPHNVVVAVSMTDYLINTTIRLSNEYAKGRPDRNRIDFRKGCMSRLCERLYEMLAKTKEAKQEWNGTNPGNLPALFKSERTLVKQWQHANMQTKQTKQRPIRANVTDAEAGRSAGGGISLHPQVGQGAGPGRIQPGRLAIGKG